MDDRIRNIHLSLGGRASRDEVREAVLNSMTRPERDDFVRTGLDTQIGAALRAKGDFGLPFAQAIGGCYVQLPLMDESEYRFVVRQKVKASRDYMVVARKYVEHCQEHLQIDISDELAA
jgi:hypothetical protein